MKRDMRIERKSNRECVCVYVEELQELVEIQRVGRLVLQEDLKKGKTSFSNALHCMSVIRRKKALSL